MKLILLPLVIAVVFFGGLRVLAAQIGDLFLKVRGSGLIAVLGRDRGAQSFHRLTESLRERLAVTIVRVKQSESLEP